MESFELLMRNFTIRLRMWGAIAVVLALLAGVGGVALHQTSRVANQGHLLLANSVEQLATLAVLQRQLGDLRRFEKELMVYYDRPTEVVKRREQWRTKADAFATDLKGLHGGPEDEHGPLINAALQTLQTYRQAYEAVLVRVEGQVFDSAPAVNVVAKDAKAEASKLTEQLGTLHQALTAEARAGVAQIDSISRTALVVTAACVLLAALLVVPLTLLNSRWITQPVDYARRVAEAIADGDLTRAIRIEGRDEASALLASLQRMQASLSRVVGQVHESSQSIHVASAEVASGNGDLSQRTEQAAAALQQTASSMEQLSTNVRQSADAAQQARALAQTASGVALRGGEAVAMVVATMEQINTSSRHIADIVATIDGIAFQTNILALNAAVEAARAGEQGRGFAVVASEVRSLAGRCAEAAREIKRLIGASVERVEAGSQQVAAAGSTMAEIVTSVQRVNQIVGEISAAAVEQSTGISQVSQSVMQLDHSTQQNAALVEESAAAAESLKEQAARLSDVVATFRLRPQAA